MIRLAGGGLRPDAADAPPSGRAADPDLTARALASVRAAHVAFAAARTPTQVADTLARRAAAVTGADGAAVYLATTDGAGMTIQARQGDASGLPERLPADPRAAIARVVPETEDGDEPSRDDLAIPILDGDRSVGILVIRGGGRADGGLGAPLELILGMAGDALERLRLRAASRSASSDAGSAAGRLSSLSRLAADLAGTATIDEVARTLVDLVIDDLGAGFALVYVPEPGGAGHRLVHARGYPAGLLLGEATVPTSARSPLTVAATERAPVDVASEGDWRRLFPASSNVPAMTGCPAISAVPMQTGGELRGVIVIGWRTSLNASAPQRDLLAPAIDQAAQALERAMLHAQDEDARRLQEAFVGVVSHELRTPITTILAGSRLLRRRLGDDVRTAELSEDIEAEAERLSRIVDDLLVLTRLERRHLALGDDPVQLGHLLGRIVDSEARRWPDHHFVRPQTRGTHLVRGDETYIEQIVRNLASNAAKYSPAGTTVTIEIDETSEAEIVVRVIDEGAGIAPDEIEDLFSLFYRSPSTVGMASGAGIGLFVSRRLAGEMGGRMWARPRPEGGSEFGFSLDRYPMDDPDLDDDLGDIAGP